MGGAFVYRDNLTFMCVQIWFCNKRQAQRRRATPLQPHEMVPNSSRSMSRVASSSQMSLVSSSPMGLGRHRMSASDHSASSGFPISSSPSALVSRDPRYHLRLDSHDDPFDDIEDDDDDDTLRFHQTLPEEDHTPGDDSDSDSDDDEEADACQDTPRAAPSHTQEAAPMTNAVTPAYPTPVPQEPKATTSAAHRRLQDVLNTASETVPLTPVKHALLPPPIPSSRRTPANPSLSTPRLLRRSSSLVRLTTSLEGRATVILEDELASSPPKPPPTPLARSAIKPRPASTPVDSSLWEFCCDSQSALLRSPKRTPPQPSEATQALRLLRTRRSTIGTTSTSVPSLPRTLSQSQPIKMLVKPTPIKLDYLQPTSALAVKRLPIKQQKSRKVITTVKKISRPKPLSSTKDFSIFEPSLDSDKENRPPGAPASPPPESKRRVLGVAGKGGLNIAPRKAKAKLGERKSRPGVDEGYGGASQESQLSVFVDDGASQDSGLGCEVRRVDEMECVENLLSLRGGTWR